jgi:hypothetical protein
MMWGNVCIGATGVLDVYLGDHFGFVGLEAFGV